MLLPALGRAKQKAQGIACILISHKLNEISKVADTITVIRDGSTVRSFDCRAGAVGEDAVIQAMVGRTLADRYPKRTPQIPTSPTILTFNYTNLLFDPINTSKIADAFEAAFVDSTGRSLVPTIAASPPN